MGQKLKIVLSDLHIGAGHGDEIDNPLEDFRANEAFIAFLHEIWHESEREERETELIINGDFFEFLQVPAVERFDATVSYPKDVYLDSSEEASIKRLNNIVAGHQDIFDVLADFMHVEVAQRSITIIKGNHDVNLYWPGVKSRLREILGASGARASLLRFANEFVSREKIYIEHGHQHAEKINGYYDSFDPTSPADPNQLYYPAGSYFVLDYVNEAESDRWFVDHVKPIPTLIWFAFEWDFDFACKALASLLQNAPELEQNGAGCHEDPARAKALIEGLIDDRIRQETSQRYSSDPAFRLKFHQQIQNFLGIITSGDTGQQHVVDDPLEMGRACQEQQHAMLRYAAKVISDREGADIILFGHSHYPIQEKLSNGCTYINTGSWVEDFSDAPYETWEALFKGTRQPSRPPAVLPYARIDYDEGNSPSARLLYFNGNSSVAPLAAVTRPEARAEARNFFEKNFDWITRLLK